MPILPEDASNEPASDWKMWQAAVVGQLRSLSSAKASRWPCLRLWEHKASPWLSPSPSRLWPFCRRPRTPSPGLDRRVLGRLVPDATVASTAVGLAPRSGTMRNKKAWPRSHSGVKKLILLQRSWRRSVVGTPRPPLPLPATWWWRTIRVRTARLRTSSCRHLAPGLAVRLPAGAPAGPSGACSAETLTGRAAG